MFIIIKSKIIKKKRRLGKNNMREINNFFKNSIFRNIFKCFMIFFIIIQTIMKIFSSNIIFFLCIIIKTYFHFLW